MEKTHNRWISLPSKTVCNFFLTWCQSNWIGPKCFNKFLPNLWLQFLYKYTCTMHVMNSITESFCIFVGGHSHLSNEVPNWQSGLYTYLKHAYSDSILQTLTEIPICDPYFQSQCLCIYRDCSTGSLRFVRSAKLLWDGPSSNIKEFSFFFSNTKLKELVSYLLLVENNLRGN